ncbi:Predicted arabinose efflux permease, MFS family [Chelatococcus sambhunathii]|uniref:Predicted arabinose efflux permease, MFS family n=1 Tax=Chelatococcus sambhunathii TaxID=363953 RepID=A0ABM9U7B2_9HYPH|nr:MFS transporter [Chelatococcus sambhunathii]CUA88860.1 Predicted arabinose efflux permease, MFS family [Chelatococcus sambhunathii]
MRPMRQGELADGEAAPAAAGLRAGARNATLLATGVLTIMSAATIAPALPAMQAHFAGTEQVALMTRLVLTIPALAIALVALPVGSLIDRWGRRPFLISAIGLYGIAGMSGLVLDSLGAILFSRALLGVAVAIIMTTATALVGDYLAGPARDRFLGLQSAAIGGGGLLCLTGGGLLAEIDWRAPFALYGMAFLLMPAVIAFIAEPARSAANRSAPGEAPAGSPAALALLLTAAALNSVIFYLVPTQLPFHLRELGHAAPSRAGLAIGLFTLAQAVVAFGFGRLRRSWSGTTMFGMGFGLMAAGYGLVAMAESYVAVVAAIIVTGFGMGLVIPNLSATALTVAPPALRGRVAGGLTASIFLGQFLSPLVSQPWIGAAGYAGTFRDMAVVLAAMAMIGLVLARRGRS